jgi:hypothetical protein
LAFSNFYLIIEVSIIKGTPIILNSPNDVGQVLERVESRIKDEKTEEWLQDLIFKHPEILSVNQFDESFAPLIPIGWEVATKSGYIDNLYISPVGRLTIVETKLWKNPEKHRTVVAQIIDYAKEVSEWNYGQLNEAILKASRAENSQQKKSLDQIVSSYISDAGLTLTEFQERAIANLRSGEFLLLIVGDKISANVALLSEAIHGSPGLDFRLGLIELQLYPLKSNDDWPVLVVPDIVGKTVETTRGVIKIQYIKEKPSVAVEISEEDTLGKIDGKITPAAFLQKAPSDLRPAYEQWFNVWTTKRMHVYWGTIGFSLRIKTVGKLQTILDAYPEWALSLIRKSDSERLSAKPEQYQKYLDAIDSVPDAINLLSGDKKYIKHEALTVDHLMTILDATTIFAESIVKQNLAEES